MSSRSTGAASSTPSGRSTSNSGSNAHGRSNSSARTQRPSTRYVTRIHGATHLMLFGYAMIRYELDYEARRVTLSAIEMGRDDP